MKRLALVFAVAVLAGCATEPELMQLPPPDGQPRDTYTPPPREATPPRSELRTFSVNELQAQLGLNRSPEELGYEEKGFDGCRWGVKDDAGTCGQRYLAVVHFRLLCRDTVGTTERVPNSLRPLGSRRMEWRLAGVQGLTGTDRNGYGQVRVVSNRTARSDRFILVIGTKSLGLEAGEVSQIVLPDNWCARGAL